MRLIDDHTLEYISQPFKYFEVFFIIIYAIIYIGIISSEPKWVHTISIIFHIFICTFLLYKFNPFRVHTLNKNDGKIIFASAVFMLANLGITEIVKHVLYIRI